MLFFLSILTASLIPNKYQQLVNRAKENAKIKVPKALRQDTKYPGVYEGDKYHFRLLKVFTNAQTNDIKGFSSETHNCAIIKRKRFSLKEGYAIIEPKTQEIFVMDRVVAEEDNVIVYESKKINIFTLMTDFVLESSTDINTARNFISKHTKRPKTSLNVQFFWDEERDRPKLKEISSGVSFGAGCDFKLGVTAKFSFKNIWDVSISFQFVFEGKFGAEFVIPNDCEIEIDTIELYQMKFPINGLAFHTKFLGLEISLGAFCNFVIELTDISIEIPIGFDYLKGYSVTATKFFEITPSSTSDSKWEITIAHLPSDDSIGSVLKKLMKASLTAALQLRPYLSLEFIVGDIEMSVEAGVKFPFTLHASLNQQKCKYPFLYGEFEIPMRMYFAFNGLTVGRFTIINSAEKEIPIKTFTFDPFCIGKPLTCDDPSLQVAKYNLITSHEDIYETQSTGIAKVEKQIKVKVSLNENESKNKQFPLMLYQGPDKKVSCDQFFYATDISNNNHFTWELKYIAENNNLESSTQNFDIKVSDMNFVDDKFEKDIEIDIKNGEDKTFLKAKINKTQSVSVGIPFTPEGRVFSVDIPPIQYILYGLYYKDENDNLVQDENAFFYLDTGFGRSSGTRKQFFYITIQFHLEFITITSSNPKKCHLRIEFFMDKGGDEEVIKVGSFYTPLFSQGEFTSENFNWEDEWMIDFDQPYEATFYYSGEIIFEDGSKIKITETSVDLVSILESGETLLIHLDENIDVNFLVDIYNPTLIVETSLTGELPFIMMIVEDVYADDRKVVDTHEFFSYGFFVVYDKNDIFQVIHIDVQPEYKYNKMFLLHINNPTDDPLYFQSPEMISVCELYGYFDLYGQDSIEVLMSRDPNTFEYYFVRVVFCDFDPEKLFLTYNGASVIMKPKMATLMLLPRYQKWHAIIMNETSGKYIIENSYLNWGEYAEYNVVRAYYTNTTEQKTVLFQNTITSIGETEPYFTIDLSIYQSFYNLSGYFYFSVMSRNAKLIKCEFNDQVLIQSGDSNAPFVFKLVKKNINDTGIAKFSAVCPDDPYGIACEITYEAPYVTGFHLIHYPNRDGISITGRGFLAELIPVEKGKEFVYYKTYNDSIETVREYSNEEVEKEDIKLIIRDSRNIKDSKSIQSSNSTGSSNLDLLIRARTICLYDRHNRIVPFSRKFAEQDMDRFIEVLGISSDIDYNYFINDENGCIIFDPKYIASNDLNVPLQACDFYSNKEGYFTNIDKSDMFFLPGGADPSQRNITILILVLAVLIIIIIIVLIVLCCICVKKLKKSKKEKKEVQEKRRKRRMLEIKERREIKKMNMFGKRLKVRNFSDGIDKNELSLSDEKIDKDEESLSSDVEIDKNNHHSSSDEVVSQKEHCISSEDDNMEKNEQCIPNDNEIVNNEQCIPNDNEQCMPNDAIENDEPRLENENDL